MRARRRRSIVAMTAGPPRHLGSIWRAGALYALLLAGAGAALAAILVLGGRSFPAAAALRPIAPGLDEARILARLLLALAAVVLLGQALGRLLTLVSQPPVIGELIAGILLGPSLLGPRGSALILPPEVAPRLGAIAQVGIILYMFIVGLDLRPDLLRRRARSAIAIAHAGIVVPFLLGALVSVALYPRLAPEGVPFRSFALFLGTAMSVTAFPVLARILTDRRMARTELGTLALGCAATDDATAWCLLAIVAGVARSASGRAVAAIPLALAYVAILVVVARPLLGRLLDGWPEGRMPRGRVALLLGALLLSCLATEWIGIHAVFGAFLLGAVIPHDSVAARTFTRQVEPVVATLFLPAYFAFAGLRTRFDLLSGRAAWGWCALVIVVATAGKFGGTLAAARLTGLRWRPAAALGALMNTRGLMELVVLGVGQDLGIVSPSLYTMMVLMAIVTTLAAGPLVAWLAPQGAAAADAGAPDPGEAASPDADPERLRGA